MKIVLVLLGIFLIPGSIMALLDPLLVLSEREPVLHPLLGGLAVAVVLYYLVIRHDDVPQVFEHELTHAIVALMFLRRISGFVATEKGGYVKHEGNFGGKVGNIMITLAPYFLPTFTLGLALLRPTAPDEWFPWFDVLIGITLGYHTASTIDAVPKNYSATKRPSLSPSEVVDTDLGQVGLLPSAVLITALTVLAHGAALHLIVDGYGAAGHYFISAIEQSATTYLTGLSAIHDFLGRAASYIH